MRIREKNSDLLKEATMMSHDEIDHELLPKDPGAIEPMACVSAIDQIMQLQLNVPLKSPLKTLHDLVTHNMELVDIALIEQHQLEEERDGESTAGNFREVTREGDLSPRTSARGGKKAKKQTQNKELVQPTRILPRRAASQTN